ncbi:YobA family protein [Paenibacillus sp. S150]|uniref:YobA family protein n=1 Tax=Paenibacillus sp. S150 TaxID=2749826 RepID=UPI001C5928E0|nr:YobA family protein [Paenibacillus sp. S150]MBW4080806.1 hypothetical protein [Paenibacillus sp. S150]
MQRFKLKWMQVCLGIVAVLLGGCSGSGDSGEQGLSRNLADATPQAVRSLLAEKKIANGDIYLEQSRVHVNIVGLNGEAETEFAQKFSADSYVLHDVAYTTAELEAAYKLLEEQKLYTKLNLYGARLDVKNNKIGVSLPDDQAEEVKEELEKHIRPDMLAYELVELGEPHVVGEIVSLSEPGTSRRILILEPGEAAPTYWFSFNAASELLNGAGERIAAADLLPGQQVKVWHTGTINESFPAQATVRRLELDM